jgi:hypothetical protein
MERVLKTISLAPSPYCLEEGYPYYVLTITETEILYAQDANTSRWSLATVLLLKVDTPFTEDEITHPLMPKNVEEKDAYIREIKYRRSRNERINTLEMLLTKEVEEKNELAVELELYKNMKYEMYRVLDSV